MTAMFRHVDGFTIVAVTAGPMLPDPVVFAAFHVVRSAADSVNIAEWTTALASLAAGDHNPSGSACMPLHGEADAIPAMAPTQRLTSAAPEVGDDHGVRRERGSSGKRRHLGGGGNRDRLIGDRVDGFDDAREVIDG